MAENDKIRIQVRWAAGKADRMHAHAMDIAIADSDLRSPTGPCQRSHLSHVRSVDIRATPRRPHLTLDLSEFQFDPRYSAEYLQRHLKPSTDLIDLLHDADEGRERTCHHSDQVILLENHEIGHGHLHH
jgi:hypothetical protein